MEFGERHVFYIAVVDDEDVVARFFKLVEVETDGFVDAATDAVAANSGAVDFFGDDDGEAGFALFVITENKAEVGATEGFAVPINVFNSSPGMKTILFR